MAKKSISDIVLDALQLTYSRALACIVFVILGSSFLVWTLLIRPGYISLTQTKDEAGKVLADRNIQLFVSQADQSVSNITTLLRAAEGALYATSSDLLSFRTDALPGAAPPPVAKEFKTGGAYVRTVRQNRRHGGLVSYEYPEIYCPTASCYDSSNPELVFFSKYWPKFLGIAKRMYAIGPEIQWVYIASNSGLGLVYPAYPAVPAGYDPRTRPWYLNALKTREVVWTKPYFGSGENDLIVTASMKIDNLDPVANAVAAIDINLQSLMSRKLSFPYCDKCTLLLATRDGDVIVERDMAKKGDWAMTPARLKLGDVFRPILTESAAPGVARRLLEKDRANLVSGNSYIFSVPVDFLDWRLIGVIPLDYYGGDGASIIQGLESIIRKTKRELLWLLGSVGAMAVLSLVLFLALSRAAIKGRLMPLLHQFVELSRMLKGGRAAPGTLKHKAFVDVAGLSSEYDDITSAVLSYEKAIETHSRLAAISETASQVAHDIRSPLAALDSALKDVSQLPEERRLVVRSAVSRIRDIANDLIEKNRRLGASADDVSSPQGPSAEEPSVQLLSSHVEPLVTEKRLQFRSKAGIVIDSRLEAGSYGLFARIQPAEFKRVLSNLVNNSVEALAGAGMVVVSLSNDGGQAVLKVEDDGQGMPPEVLARLGERGFTHGKAGGSGLGLHHARAAVESWAGTLSVQSQPGRGTAVTLRLPLAQAPGWFVSVLELEPGGTVVVLDDDASIHQVWQGRFESLKTKAHGIEVLHFSTPADARGWAQREPAKARVALYLTDYEFIGYKETGLALVESLGVGERSILITSRFEERYILEECRRLKVRVIPKGLAGFVPVEVMAGQPAPLTGADALLLDDDALVHMTWKVAAKSNGLSLAAFRDPKEFLAAAELCPKSTAIYLDSELGGGERGEDIAKELHRKGFTNLHLTTGHAPESLPTMPWIKQVLGKEPPWA
jgi:signal transduction histidine kinase